MMSDIVEELKRGAEMEEEYDADGIIRIGYKRALRYRAADEIERLRVTCTEHAEIEQHLSDEIERLREKEATAEIIFETNKQQRAEIERLRGLLRECDCALGWQGHNGSCLDQSFNDYDPDCPECKLLMRVREALGDT